MCKHRSCGSTEVEILSKKTDFVVIKYARGIIGPEVVDEQESNETRVYHEELFEKQVIKNDIVEHCKRCYGIYKYNQYETVPGYEDENELVNKMIRDIGHDLVWYGYGPELLDLIQRAIESDLLDYIQHEKLVKTKDSFQAYDEDDGLPF